jgi:NADPH:quinone reductase-like Zn-dependent oxidoreductase
MKAIVITKGGGPEQLQLKQIDPPPPQAGQARVRLHAAGLNHRDVWQRLAYQGPEPMILGSDGAGVVEGVGQDRDRAWVGKEVVINPGLHWGDREDAPGAHFQILGNPTFGTYAESVTVPVENLAPKPAHLDFVHAAAFPLAGLTAWRALFTHGRLQAGHTVLLPGIGGGVAGFALTFAKAAGARVIVTSSSPDKLKKAKEQGADFGVDYRDARWEQHVRDYVFNNGVSSNGVSGNGAGQNGIDLVLDHSGEKTIPAAVRLVRPGGRVVFLGVTTGENLSIGLRQIYFKQISLTGTTMGSPREFQALCHFMDLHQVRPEIHHIYPLEEAAAAHKLMESGGQYGKILLKM